jgi:nucleoside-diphosphate-sugar epimerase
MTVLVTGAAGFIGRYLCEKLKDKGYAVAGIDITPHKPIWCDTWFQTDITIPPEINPVLLNACENVEVIFHLAGKVHALAEIKSDEAEYHLINTDGTKNLLQAAAQKKIRKFIFFSTIKVYADKIPNLDNSRVPVSEMTETIPDTPYGQSKLDAEALVLGGNYIDDATVLRLCMVYGPGAKGNILKMIKTIKIGIPFLLPEFHNKRSMVDVRDVVNAAVLVAENPQAKRQIYIVSDGNAYSTCQIIDAIYRALKKFRWPVAVPSCFFTMLARTGDVIGKVRGRRFIFDSDALNKISGSAWFSSCKIEQELKFKADFSLQKSLPQMIADIDNAQQPL